MSKELFIPMSSLQCAYMIERERGLKTTGTPCHVYMEFDTVSINETHLRKASINAFCGENDTEATETDMQEWGEYTSDFALEVFAGDHFFIKSNAKTVQSLNEIIKRNI